MIIDVPLLNIKRSVHQPIGMRYEWYCYRTDLLPLSDCTGIGTMYMYIRLDWIVTGALGYPNSSDCGAVLLVVYLLVELTIFTLSVQSNYIKIKIKSKQ